MQTISLRCGVICFAAVVVVLFGLAAPAQASQDGSPRAEVVQLKPELPAMDR